MVGGELAVGREAEARRRPREARAPVLGVSGIKNKKKGGGGGSEPEAGGDREGHGGAAERRPLPRAPRGPSPLSSSLLAVVASSASCVFIMVPRVARALETEGPASLNLDGLLRQGFGATPEGLAGGRRAPASPPPIQSEAPGGRAAPPPSSPPVYLGLLASRVPPPPLPPLGWGKWCNRGRGSGRAM